MSPPASVEFQYQERPNTSSHCHHPPTNPNFPTSKEGIFSTGRSFPGSAPSGRLPETRSKPRLVKVRKGFGSRSSRSSAAPITADSGFNPFQSAPPSSESRAAASGEPPNFTFVFGDSNSNATDDRIPQKQKIDPVGDRESGKFDIFGGADACSGFVFCSTSKESVKPGSGCHRRMISVSSDNPNLSLGNDHLGKGVSENSAGQPCFVFKSNSGSNSIGRAGESNMFDLGDGCSATRNFLGIPTDAKLSEDLNKLNIDNATKAPVGANDTFVFGIFKSPSTTSDEMDKMKAAGNCKGVDEMNNGPSVRPVDENHFVFSASACSSSVSSHCSAKISEFGEENVKGEMDSSSFPAFGLGTRTKCAAYAAPGEEKKVEPMDFNKVPQWDAFSFSANMYSTLDGKSEHSVKSRMFKDTKPKKTKAKTRKHDILKQKLHEETGSGKSTPSVNIESTDCYSPMDFSPYQESMASEQNSPEGYVKLNPPPFTDILGRSHSSADKEDENIAASVDSQPKLFSRVNVASGDSGTGVHSNATHQEGDGSQNQFASNSETGTRQFMFASTSTQGHSLPIKRPHKKKFRVKPSYVPSAGSAFYGSFLGTTTTGKNQVENDVSTSESNGKPKSDKSMTDEKRTTPALSTVEEACEKWRLRGNQAYNNGELSRAEDFYTWGINCIPSDEASGFSVKPLVLCYSNRAATRMALGRIREALEDCLVAVTLDPCFLKAQIRAANCHLILGELEEANQNFNKCMESGDSICLDRQLVITASDGLQRSKKVAEKITRAEELLKLKTSEDADIALSTITEGISISLYSEKLLELKAEALCLLQKYEDAIQLCEKTLEFADKNFSSISSRNCYVNDSNIKRNSNMKQWRSHTLAKCYFHLGRLEAALSVLDKHESGRRSQDSDPLAMTITELLKHKNAGNEAFRSGKHAEAVEHYTCAVSCSIESRPFAAVCFCNRAATYQIIGQIADAISDCSVAMALDGSYVKAVSRRANLHEKIRDYKQASSDLQKIVSILEKRAPRKVKQSGSSNEKELEQAYQRLSSMEQHSRKEVSLDLYLILGVKRADTATEIKKAYRKAALKHHPDKAGQLLVRSESGDDGRLWKEIAESVHKDSDRLFKMIGEAYAVLSDPDKREEYDLKEDIKNESRVSDLNRGASRRESDYYGYSYDFPFERSTNRRQWQWQGGYKSKYSPTSSRW